MIIVTRLLRRGKFNLSVPFILLLALIAACTSRRSGVRILQPAHHAHRVSTTVTLDEAMLHFTSLAKNDTASIK